MAKGEEIFEDFIIVLNSQNNYRTVELDLPAPTYFSCCEAQSVFTDNIGTDSFKNDITAVMFKYPATYSAITLILQQNISGAWTDVDTLNDNTNGVFYAYGFIEDEDGNKYIRYELNWYLIYGINGEGTFRVKTVETSVFGTTNNYSSEYCLSLYHANFADGTIKIEFYNNGLKGDFSDPTSFFDYSDLNLYNSIRLQGIFGFDSSEYEREFVEYDNGKRQWIKDEQQVNYILKLKPIDAITHNFVKIEVLQSDEIFITDYNKNNPNRHIQTPVIVDGSYEPRWNVAVKKASVDVKFKFAFNNLRKKRC